MEEEQKENEEEREEERLQHRRWRSRTSRMLELW